MSDSDKITLQLYLDVQEYSAQAAKFDLQPQLVPSLKALKEAVTPTDAVLQAAGMPVHAADSGKSNMGTPHPADLPTQI